MWIPWILWWRNMKISEIAPLRDFFIKDLESVESFRKDTDTGSGPLGDFYEAVRLQNHGCVNDIFSKVS